LFYFILHIKKKYIFNIASISFSQKDLPSSLCFILILLLVSITNSEVQTFGVNCKERNKI